MSKEISKETLHDELISKQAAIYIASGYCHPANIAKELAKLPSIQPLTRCKFCEYSVCIKADDRFCSNLEAQKDGSD